MNTFSTELPCYYEFKIKGYLNDFRFTQYTDTQISEMTNGVTRLVVYIEDQAALYGLLTRLRDLGVLLLSVNQIREANRS